METSNHTTTMQTLEEINCPTRLIDAWNTLYSETNANKKFLYIRPNTTVQFRMIGPMINCRRVYVNNSINVPWNKFMSIKDLKALCQGKEEAFAACTEKLAGSEEIGGFSINSVQKAELAKTIIKIFDKDKWQKCVLSNVFVKQSSDLEDKIYVYPFVQKTYLQLVIHALKKKGVVASEIAQRKISGLYAYDIAIRNCGKFPIEQTNLEESLSSTLPVATVAPMDFSYSSSLSLSSNAPHIVASKPKPIFADKYECRLSDKPYHIDIDDVRMILNIGLNDMRTMCINNNKAFLRRAVLHGTLNGFLYEALPSDKLTEDSYKEIIEQEELSISTEQKNSHMEIVDEQINELSVEAFEYQAPEETISSLKL